LGWPWAAAISSGLQIEREGAALAGGLYDAIGAGELAEIGRVLPSVLSCRFWAFFTAY
jgi:hypothetical protein